MKIDDIRKELESFKSIEGLIHYHIMNAAIDCCETFGETTSVPTFLMKFLEAILIQIYELAPNEEIAHAFVMKTLKSVFEQKKEG